MFPLATWAIVFTVSKGFEKRLSNVQMGDTNLPKHSKSLWSVFVSKVFALCPSGTEMQLCAEAGFPLCFMCSLCGQGRVPWQTSPGVVVLVLRAGFQAGGSGHFCLPDLAPLLWLKALTLSLQMLHHHRSE